ncbi:LysM peptidoglycan-binding domain-containing protein [Roseateles sp.]|uniref:LysM peptidoglycan-binding domain-containing protein n=1 Tax=Roseateles sp. TaxID=1971397 RepID=UPI002F406E1E
MVAVVSGNGLGLSETSYTGTVGQVGLWGQVLLGARGTRVVVNAATGNLVVQDRDAALAAAGTDLLGLRTYNSRGSFNDDNGDNWINGFVRQSLRVTAGTWGAAGSTVVLADGDGAERQYGWDAATGRYVSTTGAGPDTYLYANSDGTTASFSNGPQSATFDVASGRLLRYTSSTLLNAVFAYDANGLLQSMSADAAGSGGRIVYEYNGTQLQRIGVVDENGQRVSSTQYEYDAKGRLSRVTVDLTPQDGQIGDGQVYTTDYTYVSAGDATDGLLRSIANSDGTGLTFDWTLVDGQPRPLRSYGPDGRITSYAFDSGSRTLRVTEPGGFTTDFQADADGRLLQSHPSNGANQGVTGDATRLFFEYSSAGNQTRLVDYDGRVTSYAYDADNNLVEVRDAAGNTVRSTYVNRLVTTSTTYGMRDPDGAGALEPGEPMTTRFVYNADGQLRFQLSPEGVVTEYRYTGRLPTSAITYLAGRYAVQGLAVTQAPTEAQMQTWAAAADKTKVGRVDTVYDAHGEKQRETAYANIAANGEGLLDGAARVIQYVHDAAGRLLMTIDGAGAAVSFTYDGLGRPLTRQQGDIKTSYVYHETSGGLTSTLTEQNGLVTVSTYDRGGHLLSVARSQNGNALGTTTNSYDARGLLYKTQDATGVLHWFVYDERGRQVGEVDGNGTVTEIRYDAASRPIQTIRYATPLAALAGSPRNLAWADTEPGPTIAAVRPSASAKDASHWTVYDAAGRVTQEVDAGGYVTEYRYDGAGRRTATARYANAIDLAAFAADPVAAKAMPAADAANDRVERAFYDQDGRLLAQLDAEGYLTEIRYDAGGRVISRLRYADARPDGQRAAGTLTQLRPTTASAQDQITRFINDGVGRVLGEIDAEGYVTEQIYDERGNIAQRTRYTTALTAAQLTAFDAGTGAWRPTGQATDRTERWHYDALGQLDQQTDANGTVTRYVYDEAGRVVSTTRAVGTAEVRTQKVRYDALGRVVGELSARGAALLADGQTQAQIDVIWAQHSTRYTYDAAGRRTSQLVSDGTTTQRTLFFYDEDGQLTHTINALGEVEERQYDGLGQLVRTIAYGGRLGATTLNALSGGLVDAAIHSAVQELLNQRTGAGQAYAAAQTVFDYDIRGLVKTATDALGQVTATGYNAFEQAATVDAPARADGTIVRQKLEYDRRGALAARTDDVGGANAVSRIKVDAFGRIYQQLDARGVATSSVTYDRIGRVVQTLDAGIKRVTAYDAFSRIVTITDGNNKLTRYVYNDTTRTVTVTTPEGVSTASTRNRHGEVTSATDGVGTVTSYGYDENGALRTTTTPLNSSGTEYDSLGRVSKTTDAAGTVTVYGYDAQDRVTSRTVDPGTGRLNLTTTYAYADTASGSTVLTVDADGLKTLQAFDVEGRLVSRTVDPDGLNLVTSYELDAEGRTLSVTDPNGIVTRYEYDRLGRRTAEVTSPGKLDLRRSYEYDIAGRMTASTDWAGSKTLFIYNDLGQVVYQIDPAGAVRATDYDAEGRERRVTSFATALSAAVRATLGAQPTVAQVAAQVRTATADQVSGRVYDGDGRLSMTIDATGLVVEFRYDGAGRVKQQVVHATTANPSTWLSTAAPTPPAVSSGDIVTSTFYDALGRPTWVVDAEGGVSLMAYDAAGNLVQKTEYARAVDRTRVETLRNAGAAWTLAQLGTMVNAPQWDRITNYRYDATGRLRFVYDAMGYVTETVYQGLKTSTIRYATAVAVGAAPISKAADHLSSVELDGAGREWKRTDAMGVETRNTYDAGGRLIAQTQAFGLPEAMVTGYVYDEAGHVVEKTIAQNTAAAATTRYGYDALGRMTSEVESRGVALATVDSAWTRSERLRLGYKEFVSQLSGADKQALLNRYTTTHTYDVMGRRTSTTNALGQTTTTVYDAFGNAVKLTDPLGNAGFFYFDKLNRVTLQVDPEGNATRTAYVAQQGDLVYTVTRYFYKVSGATIGQEPTINTGQIDQNGRAQFTYDRTGKLLRQTDGASESDTTAYGYNLNRFDMSVTNKAGGVVYYTTDRLGNILTETLPVTVQGKAVVNSYTYDAFGNRISSIEGVPPSGVTGWISRTTIFQYDKMGRLTHRIGQKYAAFDGATQTVADVIPVEWTRYDALGRIVEQVSRGNYIAGRVTGGVHAFRAYDGAGNQVEKVEADGAYTVYDLDAAGHVVRERAMGAPAVVSGSSWTAPAANAQLDRNTVKVYDALGRLTETWRENVRYWEADPNSNQIVAPLSPATTVLLQSLVYDAAGNVVQETDGRGNSVYTYFDRIGRKVLRIDQSGYAVAWEYDRYLDIASKEVKYAKALGKDQYRRQDDATQPAALRTPATLRAGLSLVDARTTQYTLNNLGLVTVKRVLGVTVTYLNASGAPLTKTMDSSTSYTYDAMGNLTYQYDVIGLDTSGREITAMTATFHDVMGRETRRNDPSFTDDQGRDVRPSVETEYNALGLVSRVTQGAIGLVYTFNRVTQYDYNANGDRTAMADANGHYTLTELDAMGQVSRSTEKDVARDATTKVDVVKRFAYDAMGRVIAEYDGDASHAQTGEIRRTRYNVFGDVVAKGIGDGWQEFAEYNVMGKVERNNSEGGTITVFLYDRNGNTTRKIVSADANVDLRTLTLSEAAGNLTQLNHIFSVHDARNQLIKTVEFRAEFQLTSAGREAALSQQLAPLYGAIKLEQIGGNSYGTATGGASAFPTGSISSDGASQTRFTLDDSVTNSTDVYGTPTAVGGTNVPLGDVALALGADWNGSYSLGNVFPRKPMTAPISIQMPNEMPDYEYVISRDDGQWTKRVRAGDFVLLEPAWVGGETSDSFTVSAEIDGQTVQLAVVDLNTSFQPDFGGLYLLDQSWTTTGLTQPLVRGIGAMGTPRVYLENADGTETELNLAVFGNPANGLQAITNLPQGDSTIIIRRFDAAGALISAVRQGISIDNGRSAISIAPPNGKPATIDSRPVIGSTRPDNGSARLSFQGATYQEAEFWVRLVGGGDFVPFSVSGGVIDLGAIGFNQTGASYEFIVRNGASLMRGVYTATSGAPQVPAGELQGLTQLSHSYQWDLGAELFGVPTLPVESYRTELKVKLPDGTWTVVKTGAPGARISATAEEIAAAFAGRDAIYAATDPFRLRTVEYQIVVTGKLGEGFTAPLAAYSGTLSYGRSVGMSAAVSEQRYSGVVTLPNYAGLSGDVVLSGDYNATIAAGDARRWDRGGMNLLLADWAATRQPGTTTLTYSDGRLSFTATLTLDATGAITTRITEKTISDGELSVDLPTNARLQASSLVIKVHGTGEVVSRRLIVDELGRFSIEVLQSDAGKTFDLEFTATDASGTQTLLKARNFYAVDTDGAARLQVLEELFRDAYLSFPTGSKDNVLRVRLKAREPAGAAWSTWQEIPGDDVRQLSLLGYRPGEGSVEYDYEYEITDPAQAVPLLNKGHGSFALTQGGKLTLGAVVQDRMPVGAITFAGPSVATATKMRLSIDGQVVVLDGVWNGTQMTYTWAKPFGGRVINTATPFAFTMEILDDQGNSVRDQVGEVVQPITGEATFGLESSGKGFEFKQYVRQVNVTAQLRRFQNYNAFGEVAEEYDDGTLDRARAMARQYRDQGLGDFSIDTAAVRTTYTYNTLGLLVTKTDPETFETLENGFIRRIKPTSSFGYDLLGRNVLQTDANGRSTRVTYAGSSTLVQKRYNADGSMRETQYDGFYDARKQIDELRNVVTMDYDKMGHLLTVSRLAVQRVGKPGVSQTLVESYVYDALGQRLSHTNALGFTDLTRYDSLGRVVQTTSAAGGLTKYDYVLVAHGAASQPILGAGSVDMGGYRRTTTGADQRTLVDDIDYFGRTTWHQDMSGRGFTYTYNRAGQLQSQRGPGEAGQNIEYTYTLSGLLSRMVDLTEHSFTEYAYDDTGNRVREIYGALLPDNRTIAGGLRATFVQYDELNRIARAWDETKQYDLRYEYDAVGNRRAAMSTYWDPTSGKLSEQKTYWYKYDAMNRFVTTMGSLTMRGTSATDDRGKILIGEFGSELQYDALGQRVQVTSKGATTSQTNVERYTYSTDGYLEDAYLNGALAARRTVDAAGRTTTYQAWDAGKLIQTKTTTFDRDNRVLTEVVADQPTSNGTTTYEYLDNGFGALGTMTFTSGGTTLKTTYDYHYWDVATNKRTESSQSGLGTGYLAYSYDANGYLRQVFDGNPETQLTYRTNAQGMILSKTTGSKDLPADKITVHDYFYANGRRIGDVGNDGKSDRISYAEQLANMALTAEQLAQRNKNPAPVTSVDFDQSYEPINGNYPVSAASSYTVRGGDTLSSIAQSVWGDAAMWYLIADANGLKSDEPLVEGRVLVMPNKVTNIHNNASTFRPYNAGEAIGHIDPTLPSPPPPPKKGGCGGIGMILMVVVAVVVTIYTAGALSSAAVGFMETMAAGASVMAGELGLAGIAYAAAGAAVGSIASQAVGMATGNVDKFSWNAVGQSALSAGITAGVGSVLSNAVSAGGVLNGTPVGDFLNSSKMASAMVRAGVGSAVSQVVQGKWSWREVGASTVAGGAGYLAGEAVGSVMSGFDPTVTKVAVGAAAGVAGSWASSQVMGYNSAQTRARLGQAFLSGLGNGIAGSIAAAEIQGEGSWSSSDYRNGSDVESDRYNQASAGGYRNGMDIDSDAFDPAMAYGYRNGMDIESDAFNPASAYGYVNGADIQNEYKVAASRPGKAKAISAASSESARDQQWIQQDDAILARRAGRASNLDPAYRARLVDILRTNEQTAVDDLSTRRYVLGLDAQLMKVDARRASLYGNDSGLRQALNEQFNLISDSRDRLVNSTPFERAKNLAIDRVIAGSGSASLSRDEAWSLSESWLQGALRSDNPLHQSVHVALLDNRVVRGLRGVDLMGYDNISGPAGAVDELSSVARQLAKSEVSFYGRTGFGAPSLTGTQLDSAVIAKIQSNDVSMTKALQKGEYASAYGYLTENAVAAEFGEDVVAMGKLVNFPTAKGRVRTDIDVETKAQVVQVKSGADLMSPNQRDATYLYAKSVGKEPVLMYNANLVASDSKVLVDLRARYPDFIIVPRNDWAVDAKAYFKALGR